ncbi:hypothetical protein FOZ60_016572 [Perkinsus olseni]|uniref:Uncharacterized protein n=1 Tax=Perkinsus olseni TaxID=32597 RepID=A0A7J6N3F4_PEROL|nr:hypothetical protein FOZ60_016572 [Perkinsus olseni]
MSSPSDTWLCLPSTLRFENGLKVTTGTHRGAGSADFETEVHPSPVPRTMVSAVIRTRRNQEETPGRDDGDNLPEDDEEQSDDEEFDDEGSRDDEESHNGEDSTHADQPDDGGIPRRRARRQRSAIPDLVVQPLGVANHTKRNMAVIDELLAEADGSVDPPAASLPRLENAMMMSTYELLLTVLGVGKNPWISPSTSLIGRGGEALGTNIIKFSESWNIGYLPNSPCAAAVKNNKSTVRHVEAAGKSKEFGDFCDKLDRSLSASRASPSVELISLVFLLPLPLTANLRRCLLGVCSRDLQEAVIWVRTEFKSAYLSYSEIVREWLGLVRVSIDEERPRISVAKVMATWSSIAVAENDTISSFLGREEKLWTLMTCNMDPKAEGIDGDNPAALPHLSWEQRRERLLSAMLSSPSWRRVMVPWWCQLSSAADYESFYDTVMRMRESGLKLRVLPKAESSALRSKAVGHRGIGAELYCGSGLDPNADPHSLQTTDKPVPEKGDSSAQPNQKRSSRRSRNRKAKDNTGDRRSAQGDSKGTKAAPKDAKAASKDVRRDPKKAIDFKEGRCFDCHELGHRAADCPKKKTAKSNVAVDSEGAVNKDACTDSSCASHHVSSAVSVHRTSLSSADKVASISPISDGTVPGHSENDLLLIDFYDDLSQSKRFKALLDSGSQVTLVASKRMTTPCSHLDSSRPDIVISGVGGTRRAKAVRLSVRTSPTSSVFTINAYLVRDLPVDVDVLVGIDCLRQLKAKIDFRSAEVSVSAYGKVVAYDSEDSYSTSLGLVNVKQGSDCGTLPPLPVAEIECKKRHPTIRHRGYPLSPEKRKAADEVLRECESKGYIEFIDKNSQPDQWISPCFLKRKKSGAWRLLTDLRAVNKRLPVYSFPGEAHTDRLLGQIPRWVTHFGSLDVKDAFYSVKVSPLSSQLLGATLGYRTFRWKVLAQGLNTSPYWWSRQLHWILSGIPELKAYEGRVVVLSYVDDILICGDSEETTRRVMNIIIDRLAAYNIPISSDKPQHPKEEIGFLGIRLSSESWQPDPTAVAALESLPKPANKQQLQSVLGSINYLRAAYDQSELQVNLAPLQDLLSKNKPYRWTEDHDVAFGWLTSIMFSPINRDCGVSYVLWRVRFDQCPNAISEGGELLQDYPGPSPGDLAKHGSVLMAGGRRLRGHEKRYATFDCEGLALVEGLRRARVVLLIPTKSGKRAPVVVQSDSAVALHKIQAVPDYSEFTRNQVRYKRWCRWVESVVDVLPFVKMYHCRGPENCLSDMFSRVLAEADTDTMGVYCTSVLAVTDHFDNGSICSDEDVTSDLDLEDRDVERDQDTGLASLPVAGDLENEDPPPPELIGLINANRVCRVGSDWVYQDSKGRSRTYVPEDDRAEALNAAHGDGHASSERMSRAMVSTVWWPKMSLDIDAYCTTCEGCARHAARSAAANPRYDLFSTIPTEARRFSSVAMDHLGPFIGGLLVLVLIDVVTGWLEACVVDSKSAHTTALTVYDLWVSRWGWFDSIIHDNDPGFCSAMVKSLFERHHVRRKLSPAYWPRGNGVAEAAVKEIKYVIRKSGETITSSDQLRALVAASRLLHNSSAADGCTFSPYEVVIGKKPRTLLESIYGHDDTGPADPDKIEGMLTSLVEHKRLARERSLANAIQRAERWRAGSYNANLVEGDLVFVVQQRGYSRRVALGPFRIGNVVGSLVYLRGETDPVSRGQCVPYRPDHRYPDVAGTDHESMEVEFYSLEPDMMIMFEAEEYNGQVQSLDVGRVVAAPVRDHVKVEPFASPSHLYWRRRPQRERRLLTVSKDQVKCSTAGTFIDADGKLNDKSVELLIQRGYLQQ